MKTVKSSHTDIEQVLAKDLWANGFRYRRNNRSIFGNPDFTLRGLKIAIFVDGEFWHGKDWETRKHDHKTNIEFWHRKIERNIQRDKEVNETLKEEGWKVIRFWGNEIKKDVTSCTSIVERVVLEKRKNGSNQES